ncbi:mandelate racemase/muconate lactonizing enzyme family protein [Paenochrobactrum pullorum]|uniref:mandelate racemase/muconate lactonizing enzyme family protein n=1 Tax=Paenochrobactrum pullorum TaxID=1324351 RepID=UPI0035BBD206
MPELAGNALRVFSERSALLVKITTNGGIEGWGESWAYPYAAAELIKRNLARHVLNKDITNPRAIHQALLQACIPDRRGQTHMAISALDMAIWDAYGRVANQPIAALLGGSLRESIMAYASGPLLPAGENRYKGFETAVETYLNQGFQALKIRIGIGHKQDVFAVKTARAMIGAEKLLMVDLNESSNIASTLKLASETDEFNIGWFEEPLPHDNFPGYRKLADKLTVPVAGGESFCGVQSFRDIVTDNSLGILQPDLAICGGFTEGMKVAGLADAFEIPLAPHVWGTGINFLASLQFAAVLPDRGRNTQFPLFEYDMSFNPLRSDIYHVTPDANGKIPIPDGSGLGIDIKPETFEKHITEHSQIIF